MWVGSFLTAAEYDDAVRCKVEHAAAVTIGDDSPFLFLFSFSLRVIYLVASRNKKRPLYIWKLRRRRQLPPVAEIYGLKIQSRFARPALCWSRTAPSYSTYAMLYTATAKYAKIGIEGKSLLWAGCSCWRPPRSWSIATDTMNMKSKSVFFVAVVFRVLWGNLLS